VIAAFHLIRPQLPHARLWIAGEGAMRPQLEAQIAGLGLGESVQLLGFLEPEELLRRLHAADLFVHPSRTTAAGEREGIPNALLEAMATGLPAVTTRHGGIPEAVRDGENGWLVAEGSIDELAQRMLCCARDGAARAAAGRAARLFIERNHALEERMRLLDVRYAELIQAGPGRLSRMDRLADAS
jgi:colanic acid/amylovoran biosynthesis glycosyltransferase